jgi:hypothetical protein
MPRKSLTQTRGERAATWIEKYCVLPSGDRVRLSADQRAAICRFYDGPPSTEAIAGPLAAYLVLLNLVGPEARPGTAPAPRHVEADLFTLWGAAGPELRAHLRRHGDRIDCPELGTCWLAAA